jgi:GNAT superfamily N-acetyltransferase
MVSILDACNDADRLEYINTIEDITSVFTHLTNCDPYRDMLLAEVHGETVAFSRVWWTEESAVCRLYISLGFVHPDWRCKGLGAAICTMTNATCATSPAHIQSRQALPHLGHQ